MEKKIVISKSAKKKATSQGLQYTQQVVYHFTDNKGKVSSRTKHEIVY